MIKPIDNFSFQYSEEEYSLLDYIYPVAQEYAPDFDYNEDTGESYMAVSQASDIFKGRYNARKLRHKFTVEEYMQDKELQGYLQALELDSEKFWYLLLFCYDYSWGICMKGIEINKFPVEYIRDFVDAIYSNYAGSGMLGAIFNEPISLTLKIGRKNIVIDNNNAIACIAKFCDDGLENNDLTNLSSGHFIDLTRQSSDSVSVLAYYFSKMIISAFNHQEHLKDKRKKGANLSDKEKMVIAHSLYLTGIISNESVREGDEYLKAILKRYKNIEIKKLNSFYL